MLNLCSNLPERRLRLEEPVSPFETLPTNADPIGIEFTKFANQK